MLESENLFPCGDYIWFVVNWKLYSMLDISSGTIHFLRIEDRGEGIHDAVQG